MMYLWICLIALVILIGLTLLSRKKLFMSREELKEREKNENCNPAHSLFKLDEMPEGPDEANSWWRGYSSNSQSS